MNRAAAALALGVILCLLPACGGGSQGSGSTPSATRTTPKPLPIKTPTTVTERCKTTGLPGDLTTFVDSGGRKLTGAVLGEGPHAAVLLHETGAGGLCGFVPYAAWLAAQGGRAVLLDWCSYGQSTCEGTTGDDAVGTLKAVVDWTRAQGATSVTVVGASMGGALALGAGQGAGADAIVDLSGPSVWPGVPGAAEAAPAVTVPLLLVIAPGDREMDPPALKAALAAAPSPTKRLIEPPKGHGWGTLGEVSDKQFTPSEVGQVVRDWIVGSRS